MVAALLRLAWGFLPPTRRPPARYSRFADFVRGPRLTAEFWGKLRKGCEPRFLGHNPVSAWLVVALLVAVVLASFSGWLMLTDRFFGVAWVIELHTWSGLVMAPLVLLHWAWLTCASARHRENLVASMWHGRKQLRNRETMRTE